MREYKLYLGRNIAGRGTVAADALSQYLKREVDTRLEGYTLTAGTGYWAGQSEPCIVLTYVGTDDALARLRRAASAYQEQFQQDSVLLTHRPVEAELITADAVLQAA